MLWCILPPEELHKDQGEQFSIKLSVLGQKTRTTLYHPQCDGMVERFNQTLFDMLATVAKTSIHLEISPLQGELHIQFEHSLLSGFTPFFLMFGSQAQLPLNLMHGIGQQEEMLTTEYARNLKQSLEEAYALEQTKHSVQHERRKAIYDQKTHNKPLWKWKLGLAKFSCSGSWRVPEVASHVEGTILSPRTYTDYRIKMLSRK